MIVKEKSRALSSTIQRLTIVWSIFLLGLILSIFLSYKEYNHEQLGLKTLFNDKVDAHINLIQNSLSIAEHDFEALRKFYPENSPSFDYKNFELYAENVCSFNKAVWAIGWLPRVTDDKVPEFLKKANQWQSNKQAEFRIWKLGDKKQRDFYYDKKPEYYPILYFYPQNTEVIGFDESSQIDRTKALQRALITGLSSVSTLIELIPQVYEAKGLEDKDRTTKALLMFIPIFSSDTSTTNSNNKNIKGIVLGIIKLDTLLSTSIEIFNSIGINLKIYQLQEGKKTFIQEINASNQSKQRKRIVRPNFNLSRESEIKFQDSNIVIEFDASASFYHQNTNEMETLILLFGMSISSLIALFINRKLTYTRDIEDEVNIRTTELVHTNQKLVDANEKVTAFNEELQSLTDELNIAHDELLENEIELRRNLKLLETIISKSPMMIIIHNRKDHTRTCNEQFSKVFDWSIQEFESDPDPLSKMLLKEDDIELTKKLIQHPDSQFRESRLKTKDGRIVDQRWANFEIDKEMIVSIGFDITQERYILEHMMIEQKEQNLTMLAGGIAHDFNNILVGVLNGAEILLSDIPEEQKSTRDLAQIIYHSARRMSELTQQMLAYAKGGRYNPLPANINNLILEAVNLTKGVRKSEVNIEINLDPEVRLINADHSQLHQVLINLLVNASEAIPHEGGRIKITTQGISDNDALNNFKLLKPNELGWVLVQVEDTGTGISEDNLNKIFDPFFSTKFVGRGLGLAAVKGIIENHKGLINVSSKIGNGTLFQIVLPASSVLPAIKIETQLRKNSTDVSSSSKINPVNDDNVILLVEDEPIVRELIIRILQRLKLKVEYVESGEAAIELFKIRSNEIDLIILDMQLPGISGTSTYNIISQLKPEIKALFCSGYSQQHIMTEIPDDRNVFFIQKPFLPNIMLEKLVEMKIISQ